jgi:hypothetical protein
LLKEVKVQIIKTLTNNFLSLKSFSKASQIQCLCFGLYFASFAQQNSRYVLYQTYPTIRHCGSIFSSLLISIIVFMLSLSARGTCHDVEKLFENKNFGVFAIQKYTAELCLIRFYFFIHHVTLCAT